LHIGAQVSAELRRISHQGATFPLPEGRTFFVCGRHYRRFSRPIPPFLRLVNIV